jgi:cation diffusion facilitator family transporter
VDNRHTAAQLEQRALKISVAASLLFALLAFGFVVLTHSEAILLDGVISLVGLGVSLLTLFVARLVELPGDDTFPFGYGHFEPMVNVVKSLIMVTVCVFALIGAISSILQGGNSLTAGLAIVYALIATIGSGALAYYMLYTSRYTASTLVAVDAKSWLLDAVISAAVLLTFVSMYLLRNSNWAEYLPYVDPGLVAFLVIIALPVPLKILRENMREVISMAPSKALQDAIHQQVLASLDGEEYEDIRLRILKQGRQILVFADIVLGSDYVLGTVATLDRIRTRMTDHLQEYDSNIEMKAVFIGDPRQAA